jgi:hypothetical protein
MIFYGAASAEPKRVVVIQVTTRDLARTYEEVNDDISTIPETALGFGDC